MPLEYRKVTIPKNRTLLHETFFSTVGKDHPWLTKLYPILKGKDKEDDHYLHGVTYALYYEIGKLLKPKSVLEIGVRNGYSLASICSGAEIKDQVYGIDFETYVTDSVHIATKALKDEYGINAQIVHADSHLVDVQKEFGRNRFDLIHIDGDHSTNGALMDLLKFSKFTNRMLVDDITDARVWAAVSSFVASCDDPVSVTYIDSTTGFVLIEC